MLCMGGSEATGSAVAGDAGAVSCMDSSSFSTARPSHPRCSYIFARSADHVHAILCPVERNWWQLLEHNKTKTKTNNKQVQYLY